MEEQFYVLFPLILFGLLWARQKPPGTRKIIGLILPALLLTSFVYSIFETKSHPDSAYFLLPSRFWELAAGALLCLAHQRKRFLPYSPLQAASATSLGLAILALSIVWVEPEHFPFPLAIPPVIGSLLCISGVVSVSATGAGFRFLTHPAVVYVGRISYSLYLYHWLVIVMLRWTIGAEGIRSGLLALALTFLLAAASYHFIETTSILRHAVLHRRKLATLAAGVCIIFLSHQAFGWISNNRLQNRISQSMVIRNRADWYPRMESGSDPAPPDASVHWQGRRLFCIGDSHAFAYAGMCRMLEVMDGVSVHIDFAPGQAFCSLLVPNDPAISKREQAALEFLKKSSRPGDVVFLPSLRTQRLCDQTGHTGFPKPGAAVEHGNEAKRERAVLQACELVKQLLDLKLHVVLSAPTPVFASPPFRGADWFNHMNPVNRPGFTVDYQWMEEHRSPAMQSLRELQQEFPAVHVWDPLPVFRSGTVCSAFEGSPPNAKPLFFDGDHLSDYGGRKLYPSFKKLLANVWN